MRDVIKILRRILVGVAALRRFAGADRFGTTKNWNERRGHGVLHAVSFQVGVIVIEKRD
jgi:hypothetical protein